MKSQDATTPKTIVPLKKIGEVGTELPPVEQKEVLETPDVKQDQAFPKGTEQSVTQTREGGTTAVDLLQGQQKRRTGGKGRRQKLLKVPVVQTLARNQKPLFRQVREVVEQGAAILQAKQEEE